MQEIMRGLQERHATSHAQFEATDTKLTRSLRAHNRVRAGLRTSGIAFQDTGTADAASSEESSEEHTKDVEMVTAGPRATAEPDGKNPLLDGAVRATESFDVQAKRWGKASDFGYLYFDHWKHRLTHKSNYTRLRFTLEELLPRLMGARDYAGAAKVLAVMYHRFAVTPALCIEASLEILRRQPDYRNDLLKFYESALKSRRIDMEEAEDDARLLANFGILCYWLMFIESKELRERLQSEDMDEEEEDDADADTNDGNGFDTSENIESVIESSYLFKTPIGVHILYQHSNSALRRAVALSPNSAMFLEHLVQLLVLVGDIQPACDYLEAFFHLNPEDPHGPRMLAGFLESYYPDSVDAQVAAFSSRWMKNDPSCSYPLEKMLELSSAGAVSSFSLTAALVEALDTCGSDLYLVENPEGALALWRNLAELLAAMDEDEFMQAQIDRDPLQRKTIADVGEERQWWKRVYFARPSSVDEVAALAQRDTTFMEVSIYRAAVADRLFPGLLPMMEALRSAMSASNVAFSQEHRRLFKRYQTDLANLLLTARISFSTMPFMHVTVTADNERQKNRSLPVFKGSSDTLHVIDRKSIVEKEVSGDKAEVVVTGAGETNEIDPKLVEELYEVLESEVGYSTASTLRSRRKRKADDITPAASTLIPAYVGMIEEEILSNPDASWVHVNTILHEKLRRSDMLVPTSTVVKQCMEFFQNRLRTNLTAYGHGGLMIRYEEFIATYVRRQRAKGQYEVTKDGAKEVVELMKRALPSPHPYFPSVEIVEETMRIKAGVFSRQRRLRLIEIKKLMKAVLRKLVYVDEKIFVDAWDSVCQRNGLFGVVTRTDIACALQIILPRHYYTVLEEIPYSVMRRLTSPTFRRDCNTAEEIHEKLGKGRRTLNEVKALLWVERYEALYGPYYDEEDKGESDSDISDSDSNVSSVSVSSVSVSSVSSDSSSSDSDSDSDSDSELSTDDNDTGSSILELRDATKKEQDTKAVTEVITVQDSPSEGESGHASSSSDDADYDDDDDEDEDGDN
ncbi:hypothetical protein PHYSODRAFT_489505 [Phytophthora sojae]|uniref:Uncharacterized protein n=1 Tax=Phytophthora sojae (strain P6497) TaxID=1094619 RepID=G4Z4E8_PHYSP|nr:hypothetical protein PHYSODRAFT_489505 [Phytophthora sojae]EGZ20152.1 hypothetical protein PHYSODRAFT_489505 [Phytophthora sojae]|eukprot:XP_009522869.1 hypothetical protein PHYSODRAFT_489505 [Phytophthora sojae]